MVIRREGGIPPTGRRPLQRRHEEELAKRFGGLVRRLRSERGYSQEEFSFRVGLHQTYISSVERGQRNVTIGTADKIAKALGTTLSATFLELEQGPSGPTSEQ